MDLLGGGSNHSRFVSSSKNEEMGRPWRIKLGIECKRGSPCVADGEIFVWWRQNKQRTESRVRVISPSDTVGGGGGGGGE